MRALFVNENLGGHATVHVNVRRALVSHTDIEATFFDVPAPDPVRKFLAAPVPGLAGLDLDLQPLRYQLAQSAIVRRALARLAPHADVVHVYTHNAALLSTAILRRKPTVVSLDGTNEQNAYRLPYRVPTRFTPAALRVSRRFEQRVYDAATLVVAQSQWAAESLLTYGVDPGRMRMIPFGVTVPATVPSTKVGRPRIVFVGRSLERKGGHRLLRLYREHLSDAADLEIVTLDPVEAQPGVHIINDVRPGDGRLDAILGAATVFAFPSEMDLSPNVVLEAMAMGLPVVALRAGAVGELVVDGVTGLLVEPADDRALVSAIRALLDDPARAARMGAAGRARVLDRFDARRTTAALADVLREAQHLHTTRSPHPTTGRNLS